MSRERATRHAVLGTLEAVVLLVMGIGSLLAASQDVYARLMNPSFRAVTIGGALLVTAMGLILLVRPRQEARPAALLVFLVFLAIVALGRPFAPGVSPLLPVAAKEASAIEREGYEPLPVAALFETIREEAPAIAEDTYICSGLVYRSPETDAEGVFILLEPMMACCLADAIAFGVRVQASAPLPDPLAWVHVLGTLRTLPQPVETAPFRLGAILFTNVSRLHLLVADEVLPWRALLPDIVAQIPQTRCRFFLDALEATGLAETLRGEETYTVFAPHDIGFERLDASEREALFAPENRPRLRALCERFLVRGTHAEEDLYDLEELETVSGQKLRVETVNGRLRVAGANILFGDQQARNGVVHLVHPAWFLLR